MFRLNNNGVAIVYLALMLTVLIGIAALVIDLGFMFVAKNQLQNAADAGALAGAGVLKVEDYSGTIYSARVEAQSYAAKNKAAGETLTLDLNTQNKINGDIVDGYWGSVAAPPDPPVPPTFTPSSPSSKKLVNAIKVVARRTGETGQGIGTNNRLDVFFGKIFGWSSMGFKQEAIALASLPNIALPIVLSPCSSDPVFKDPNYDYSTEVCYHDTYGYDVTGKTQEELCRGFMWTDFLDGNNNTGSVTKFLDASTQAPDLTVNGAPVWTAPGVKNNILLNYVSLYVGQTVDIPVVVVNPYIIWTDKKEWKEIYAFLSFVITKIDASGADKLICGRFVPGSYVTGDGSHRKKSPVRLVN